MPSGCSQQMLCFKLVAFKLCLQGWENLHSGEQCCFWGWERDVLTRLRTGWLVAIHFPSASHPFLPKAPGTCLFRKVSPAQVLHTAFPVRHWHRAEWHLTPDQSLDFKIKSRTEFKTRKQCGEEIVSPRDLSHGGVSEDSICNV